MSEEATAPGPELPQALNGIGSYVFTKDLQGRYTYANAKVCELFGRSLEQVLGRDDSEFFDLVRSQELRRNDREVIDTGRGIEREERNILPSGELRIYWTAKVPMRDEQGRITGVCGISTDITEMYRLREELRVLADTDALTGLSNRRRFLEQAEAAFVRARVNLLPAFSLLLVDVDHFKGINDQHGHQAGDRVLRAIAGNLKATLRDRDLLGRLGGDEFAVLMQDCSVDDALRMAGRLCAGVRRLGDDPHWPKALQPTLSIGVAAYEADDEDLQALLARADRALYRVKAHGRDGAAASRPRDEGSAADRDSVSRPGGL
jgi:diguanylate cyclase (GGDEF)-like protein/PAS domain S-box-containing protein